MLFKNLVQKWELLQMCLGVLRGYTLLCVWSKSGRGHLQLLGTRPLLRQLMVAGQARLREHVAVEHALAHVGREQRGCARYRGIRKTLFDLRCCMVVDNQHVMVQLNEPSHAP
jgi:hypothetical protein